MKWSTNTEQIYRCAATRYHRLNLNCFQVCRTCCPPYTSRSQQLFSTNTPAHARTHSVLSHTYSHTIAHRITELNMLCVDRWFGCVHCQTHAYTNDSEYDIVCRYVGPNEQVYGGQNGRKTCLWIESNEFFELNTKNGHTCQQLFQGCKTNTEHLYINGWMNPYRWCH